MLKYEVLKELRSAPRSGRLLAEKFGVSRTAVWKAICALKQEGYDIEGVSGAGYILRGGDVLCARNILEALDEYSAKYADNARLGPLSVVYAESLDSTNDEAKRLAAGADGNILVAAGTQTAGKGRMGRSFYSPPKSGIYFSLLLKGRRDFSGAVKFTSLAAAAAMKAIYNLTGIQPEVKWVNDLYVNGKKVCGILTEAVTDLEGGGVSDVIIGIGVNLTTENFPDGIVAASLKSDVPRSALIAGIAAEILQEAPFIAQNRHIQYYREHSLALGKEVVFIQNGAAMEGIATQITDDGALVVRCGQRDVTLASGEISLKVK